MYVCDKVVVDLYCGIGYYTIPYLCHAKAKHVHACEWNPHSILALRYNLELNKVNPNKYTIYPGDNNETVLVCGCLDNVAEVVSLGLLPSSRAGWPLAVRVLKLNVAKDGGNSQSHDPPHLHPNESVSASVSQCSEQVHTTSDNSSSTLSNITTTTTSSSSVTATPVAVIYLHENIHERSLAAFQEEAVEWFRAAIQDRLRQEVVVQVEVGHVEIVKSYAPRVVHVVLDLHVRLSRADRQIEG